MGENNLAVSEVLPIGRFADMLKRNNKQIRDDRAEAISEDCLVIFRRRVEDIQLNIKKMERELDNMIDLSPETAMSLVPAKDFDANAFVEKRLEIGVRLRNEKIKLEIAQNDFNLLFSRGGK